MLENDFNDFNYLTDFYPTTPSPMINGATRTAFKAIFSSSEPVTESSGSAPPPAFDIDEMRAGLKALLEEHMIVYPDGMGPEQYKQVEIGGLQCYVILHKNSLSVPTLVMFPGGGFCFDNREPHQAFMAHVAKAMDCNIVVPDCPLAPENKASKVVAAIDDFMRALSGNPASFELSEDLKLMGWSSGACLVLGAALNLRQYNIEQFKKISQLILLSPWVDLSLQAVKQGPYQKQQALDTAAGADILEVLRKAYLDEIDYANPAYAPLCRDSDELKNLPPISIIAGECEALIADAVYTAQKLGKAKARVTLVVKKYLTHNYMVFNGLGGEDVARLVAEIANTPVLSTLEGCTVKKFEMHKREPEAESPTPC